MADLYHLLDGLDEGPDEQQQQEQEQILPEQEEEEWEQGEAAATNIPEALEEAARQKEKAATGTAASYDDEYNVHVHNDYEEDDLEQQKQQVELLQNLVYTKLYKAWTQELQSPELLPFDVQLFDEICVALQQQQERLESSASASEINNSNSNSNSNTNAHVQALLQSILAVDVERTQFLLANWLQERLWKIEAHPVYMRECIQQMSEPEVTYLKEYGTMMEQHLRRMVVDHFPQDVWKKLDEPYMIDQPDLETFCFVRTREEILIPGEMEYTPADSILIVQYHRIRDFLKEHKVELVA